MTNYAVQDFLSLLHTDLSAFVCFFNRFFNCSRWLAVDEEDGKVQVLLVITEWYRAVFSWVP